MRRSRSWFDLIGDNAKCLRYRVALGLNEVPPGSPDQRFCVIIEPTALQEGAFELLGIDRGKFVPSKMTA